MRDIILELGRARRTVLVSSHVLHEIESLTDKIGVLAHGRLLGYGHLEQLLQELRDRHPHRVHVGCDQPRKLGTALLALDDVQEVTITGENELEFVTGRPEVTYRELPAIIVATGSSVHRLEAPDDTLEAVFEHVTAVGSRRL